ncbi:MAG: hypothetical protein JXA21_09165 [Anaerolineae bacterium]|nr:hypothetical protein [Anaerolineae bacterium]
MSKNTKIILGIVLGIVVICGLAAIAGVIGIGLIGKRVADGSMFTDDPEEAASAAAEMLSYDLPDGYREQAVMNLIVGKMLVIAQSDLSTTDRTTPIIMIMQLSALISGDSMSQEDFQRQMEESMTTTSGGEKMELELVEEKEMTIAGQETQVLIYEGTNSEGAAVREVVTSMFKANGKQTIVMIIGPISTWPEEEMDAFLLSIK